MTMEMGRPTKYFTDEDKRIAVNANKRKSSRAKREADVEKAREMEREHSSKARSKNPERVRKENNQRKIHHDVRRSIRIVERDRVQKELSEREGKLLAMKVCGIYVGRKRRKKVKNKTKKK